MRCLPLTLCLGLSLALSSCTGAVSEPADPSDATDTTDDTDSAGCEVVDCANPACSQEFECTWPTEVDLVTDIDFAGGRIDCFIPINIDDCVTDATSRLVQTQTDACEQCDRTYVGPMAYQQDTCSELIDQVPPDTTALGIVFVSPTERELWGRDDAGVWSLGATVTGSNGVFISTTVEPIEEDVKECGQGVQTLGIMTAELTFTDVE